MTSHPITNLSDEEQYALVHQCITAIASHCDGAVTQDRVGFNGSDTKFGRRIAAIPFEDWTDEIKVEAARILGNTYRVQAQNWTGIDARELTVVRDASECYTNYVARDQARQSEKRATATSKRFITKRGAELDFKFPYDVEIKDALKAAGCRFIGSSKVWSINASDVNKAIVDVALRYGFNFTDEVDALLDAAKDVEVPVKHTGTVSVRDNGTLLVTLEGRLGGSAFSEYRSLAGYNWVRGTQQSTVSITESNVAWLEAHDFTGCEWARKAVAQVLADSKVAEAAAEERLEASRKADSDLDLSSIVPEGLTPYGFQVAGVEYALKTRRTIIGDEMGLGKTVQAILAVEAARKGL